MKISQKLWLLTTGIILILSAGFYVYFSTSVEQQFREGFLKKGEGLVQATSSNLGAGLFFNDEKFSKNVMTSLENDPDISFIYVTDSKGSVRYGYHYYPYTQLIRSFLDSNELERFTPHLLLLKQSIFFHDEYQGNLVLGLNMNWVESKVRQQHRRLILITGGLALFLIVFSVLLARPIARPLTDAAEEISKYNNIGSSFNLKLPEKGGEEFSQLARAWNQLSSKLNKNITELNKSKRYLETLFQLSPIPILIADTIGQIEEVNESARQFFEIERDILVKMNLDRFFQEEDLNAILNRLVQEGQEVRGYVTTIKMTDGSRKVVELNVASYQSELNYVQSIIFAIIDISEKIQIQREILHNQTKLQRVNEELVVKTQELEKLSARNRKNAKNLEQLIDISQQMMRASIPSDILDKIISEGSHLLEAHESMVFLWDTKGKRLKLSKVSSEEVYRRIKQSSVEPSNLIYRAYKDQEPMVFDSDGLPSDLLDYLGFKPQKKFSLLLVPISEKDYCYGVIALLKYGKDSFRLEDMHLLKTLANQAAILLENIYLLNELKEKAQSLQKAYEELQKSQQQVIQLQKMESLGTLVGGIAHDFNNILGIIIPNTDLLRKDAGGDARIIRRANIIAESAQRAADLTRQLLMFSRNQDMQLKVLSPNELISGLSRMLGRTLGKEYEVILNLDPNVKNVEADETRITQVLINLAVNARDAMPEGGKIVISTRMKKYKPHTEINVPEREYVCISVSDSGVGIRGEDLDKIFDPFFTTKGPGKGSGLGLSVVYGIVKGHKGYVDVESVEGKGATFYIYLPPSQKERDIIPQEMIRNIPRGTEQILIVDDEKMVRESAREILESLGYQVTLAESGIKALEIVRLNQHQFKLAIVDMSMPRMNGIETIRELRKLDGSIKILLSSGYIDKERKEAPLTVKIDGTLPKPYRMKELAIKVRQLLNHKSAPAGDPVA